MPMEPLPSSRAHTATLPPPPHPARPLMKALTSHSEGQACFMVALEAYSCFQPPARACAWTWRGVMGP